ncbi:DMT family transporter [Modestobacter altitudinis]|uniref:DMT family transporter n=1 Tax=Modestobacter altitudinis TaxID=2213158 RepID=UPI00110CDAB9|nr:DMT family transporter [Modestobacter altitudinis]
MSGWGWAAVGLALLSAALTAVASAVQQRSAAAVPDGQAGGLRLLRQLLRSRWWWTGTLADSGGYLAQAAALGLGSLVLVQPLLVTTVLFALPLGARWSRRRLSRSDWAWAGVLVLALAVFMVTGEPTAGEDLAGWRSWLPAWGVLGAVVAACLVGAAVRRGTPRAVLLAVTTGVAYGLGAALTKGVVSLLDDGPAAVLGSWSTYLLVVVLAGGTLVQQSAYQAGPLEASLPAATVGEPVVAVALGLTVLGERVQADGAEWLLIAVLTVAMGAATVALARSSAVPVRAPVPRS